MLVVLCYLREIVPAVFLRKFKNLTKVFINGYLQSIAFNLLITFILQFFFCVLTNGVLHIRIWISTVCLLFDIEYSCWFWLCPWPFLVVNPNECSTFFSIAMNGGLILDDEPCSQPGIQSLLHSNSVRPWYHSCNPLWSDPSENCALCSMFSSNSLLFNLAKTWDFRHLIVLMLLSLITRNHSTNNAFAVWDFEWWQGQVSMILGLSLRGCPAQSVYPFLNSFPTLYSRLKTMNDITERHTSISDDK